ncbi:MAG: putative sensor histidine kinase with a response regulator receiver domain [Moraxellaceae bacterium]|nr:putative sensor histidine kinase with a response regulator receiver domain [Moraxellaceae bacterium]
MVTGAAEAEQQEQWLRVAVAGLLGIIVLWSAGSGNAPALGVWYVPVVALAHFQDSRPFICRITLLALLALWFGCFWSAPPDQPSGHPLLHCLGVSLALLAVHAVGRHYFRRCRRELAAAEALHQRQTDIDVLTESLPLHIWTASPGGQLEAVSRRFLPVTGRLREDILADWTILLHPDDRERTVARWQHSIETGEAYENEVRFQAVDGRYIWHLVRAVPERDAQGNILRWLGSAQDIDHIHALRAQAQALAERMQNTLESITDALFALDANYRFTYVNAKAAAMLGHPRNELLGRSIQSVLEKGGSNPFVRHCRHALETQRLLHVQEWYTNQKLWLDIRLYPSKEGLTVYFLDITRQREEEMELRLLRTAVSRLSDIIMITEAEPLDEPGPRTIFVNEAFERITGYRKDEVLGRSPRFMQGPETQRHELDRIREALERYQPVRAQVINYKKSHQPFWLEIDIAPIADARGRYTHFVSVERDITESKEMARQLQHALRMEGVGLLTGGIAHDFNNLLTVVLGNADMLAEALDDDAELAPLARMIVQAAGRGASLVRSLLAFARRQSLTPEAVAVDALVRELLPILEASLTQRHQLELHVEGPLWAAYVDRGQLESALLNLVINARDAMAGSGTLTLTLANTTLDEAYVRTHEDVVPGDYVMVAVSDTGTGIAPEYLDRIFEPFFSTKSIGHGSGLGLSSVFGFVKQSGGHIAVASELGRGTTFRLYLPRSLHQAAGQAGDGAVGSAGTAGQRILVVEDDEGIRRLAVQYLEQAGYRTQVAPNGEVALELLDREGAPDLLFTDVVMPGALSGPLLAHAARQRFPALPVLYASGNADVTNLLAGEHGGNERFLAKPYRREQLLAQVAALLGQEAGRGLQS